MYEKLITAQVAEDGLDSFVICLALGTLVAIKERIIDSDAGIWTLARPIFWERFKDNHSLPPEVIDVLQSSDEISALLELNSVDGEKFIDECIGKLKKCLSEVKEPSWYMSWDS
jgi:hypothetical protein